MIPIDDYWSKHLDDFSFEEKVQVFRQRKCCELIQNRTDESSQILEIGPGFTPVAERLARFRSYLGIEPGAKPFSAIASRFADDERINFCNSSFNEMESQLTGSHFDVIVSSGVLGEGGVNPEDFLAQVGRLMGPSSIAYINVPNANSMHRVIGKAAGYLDNLNELSPRQAALGVRELFDLQKLRDTIIASVPNARIEGSGSFFLKPFTHKQLDATLRAQFIDESVLEGLYQSSEFFPEFGAEIFVTFSVSA
jgi:SAM-dependent methyltransferase